METNEETAAKGEKEKIVEMYNEGADELGSVFDQLLQQIEALLRAADHFPVPRMTSQNDTKLSISLDIQVMYFFVADIINYTPFMYLRLAQMNNLEDSVTYDDQ